MRKIKALLLGMVAALGLVGCGGKSSAFVEQNVRADYVAETETIHVELPRKRADEWTDVKGYVQVKIRDVGIGFFAYTYDELLETYDYEQLSSIYVNLRKDHKDTYVDEAYKGAIGLEDLTLEDNLNYKILASDVGQPYYDGLALKLNINLRQLIEDVHRYGILEYASYFKIVVFDATSSIYSLFDGPYDTVLLKYDEDAGKIIEYEVPAPVVDDGDEE